MPPGFALDVISASADGYDDRKKLFRLVVVGIFAKSQDMVNGRRA